MMLPLATLALIVSQPPLPTRYYAFPPALDEQGVIAPWYDGYDGQVDRRVRIAAETLKRYPWTEGLDGAPPAPEYVFSGAWRIAPDGTITVPRIDDWPNGDLGQRAAYVLAGLIDYYRYTGDPAAIAHIQLTADHLLDNCLTAPDHPWPGMLVSVPVRGKPYGKTDPHGFIQLDIVAEVGLQLVRAYEVTGERRWLETATHWANLLAEHCDTRPGSAPWGRYANPEDVPWEDTLTGGVVYTLYFLDELVRIGYTGDDGALLRAREAGVAYLRDTLLPRWTEDHTWGRNYWDWANYVQAGNVTELCVRYFMEHPDEFPNWRTDCRNVLSLFLCRSSVNPESGGDVFSGAWAYPEASNCCGRSLWYCPLMHAPVWMEYASLTGDPWAREIGRRAMILATYDCHETGVVEDNIDGGAIVADGWFKIAHPMALRYNLNAIAWMPEEFGATCEDHIVRSDSVVRRVRYEEGRVAYETYDAPEGTTDILRLSFRPVRVRADGQALRRRDRLEGSGFDAERLDSGDWLVRVRHDSARSVCVEGEPTGETQAFEWSATSPGEETVLRFSGHRFRLTGLFGPEGGLADAYLDGEKLLVGLDCWAPKAREGTALYRSGLANGPHELRIVARGAANPRSGGTTVRLTGLTCSTHEPGDSRRASRDPIPAQRVILGYGGRSDYVDTDGNAWRSATEVVVRLAALADVVKECWWEAPRCHTIAGADDPELYRHGIHAPEFTVYFTVSPGAYHVRLKLAETRRGESAWGLQTIDVNGRPLVENMDVGATAGGICRAVDLVANGVTPQNGVIAVRVRSTTGGEAILQAAEVGPGDGGVGAEPVTGVPPQSPTEGNLLQNGGFEEGGPKALGRLGARAEGAGWQVCFASPTQSYVWVESGFDIHPECGLPEPRTGKEALRTHTDGAGHTIIFQEVSAAPDTRYRASAWAQAADIRGQGFGRTPGDSAGLIVQEIGADGAVLAEHTSARIATAGPYVELACELLTSPNTVRLRFILDAAVGCRYDEGHVTYDDCALEKAG